MKQVITEEMKIQDEWYKQADKMTMDKLPEFLKHLTEDYQHDYGTICHAISAGALATVHAMNNLPCGGITGFQAGFVMWGIIREMNYRNNKCGLRIQDMDKLLYPQYEEQFHCISNETWQSVRKEAVILLEGNERLHEKYLRDMEQYEKDMNQFEFDVKQFESNHPEYPKYEDNKKFYEHIDFGTQEEWDAEQKKEESGFMFAPRKPYDGSAHPDVIKHWRNIVDGNIPFGLRLEE